MASTRRRGCSAVFTMFDKRGFSNKQDFLSCPRTLLLGSKAASKNLNYRIHVAHLELLKRIANEIDSAVLKSNNLGMNAFLQYQYRYIRIFLENQVVP